MKAKTLKALSICLFVAAFNISSPANSATIFANTVIDFFNSGAGPIDIGAYGGEEFGGVGFPVSVPTSFATDGDSNSFVSLPTGSFITLGFSGGTVFDGAGDDIFISEPGNGSENANVFVSSDLGATFTLLGIAFGNTLTALDLADIGFLGNVNAVKIVGLDNGGGSPGFDVAFVQGLEGSVSVVPIPAALPLYGTGIAIMGFIGWRRKRKINATA